MMKSTGRERRGVTTVEMLVATIVFSMIFVIAAQYQRGARRMEEKVTDVNGALRSGCWSVSA